MATRRRNSAWPATAGYLLRAVGYLCYGIGAASSLAILATGHRASRVFLRSWSEGVVMAGMLLLGLAAAVVLVSIGHQAVLLGKRTSARARRLQSDDILLGLEQRFVLYLRSFKDDEVTATTPTVVTFRGVTYPRLSTEEEHLDRALNGLGRFLAIANPREDLPNPGATRIESDDAGWRHLVLKLMDTAQLVVIRVSDGDYLWWEVEQSLKRVRSERLLFLIPHYQSTWRAFRRKLNGLGLDRIPALAVDRTAATSVAAIMYFSPDGTPRLVTLKSAGLRSSHSQPLRAMLRLALKPVFDQLGVRWTPPPIPSRVFVPVVFYGYFTAMCLFWLIKFEPWSLLRPVPGSGPNWILLGFSLGLALMTAIGGWRFFKKTSSLYQTVRHVEVPAPETWTPGTDDRIEAPARDELHDFFQRTYEAWSAQVLPAFGQQHTEATSRPLEEFIEELTSGEPEAIAVMRTTFPPQADEFLVSYGESDSSGKAWFVLTNRRLIQRDGATDTFQEIALHLIRGIEYSGLWTKRLRFDMTEQPSFRFTKVDVYPAKKRLLEVIDQARGERDRQRALPT